MASEPKNKMPASDKARCARFGRSEPAHCHHRPAARLGASGVPYESSTGVTPAFLSVVIFWLYWLPQAGLHAGNDHALDFAGAFVNFGDFSVAEIALHRQLFAITQPGMDLQRR